MDGMDEYESAFRSNEHYICSSENKAWKSNFFLLRITGPRLCADSRSNAF